jgi:hypothetical protein
MKIKLTEARFFFLLIQVDLASVDDYITTDNLYKNTMLDCNSSNLYYFNYLLTDRL